MSYINASEVTTLHRHTNLFIIIIFIITLRFSKPRLGLGVGQIHRQVKYRKA